MSIILRTLQDRQNVDTTGKTTAVVSFEPKWIDSHHDGHIALIKHAQSLADIVFVHYWYTYPLMDFLFGDKTDFYRTSTFIDIPNEQYMIDWCNLQGVDYIWLPTKDYYNDWFQGYNINDLKTWADNLCIKEGYIYSNVDVIDNLKRIMITLKPLIDNQYYSYDYRVGSSKDGILRYFEKDFYNKYLGVNVIVLEDVLSIDGLPLFSSNYFSEKDIEKIAQINTSIIGKSNINITGNYENFKTEIENFTTSITDVDISIRIEKMNVVNISKFLPLNKIIIETTIFIDGKGRYKWNILK